MESKKINQLATNLAPVNTDLTVIGDPLTGELKKITLLQIASLFGAGLTSVGMVVPSGFSVSPATLTSSGTFTIAGAGSALEYIDGTGALQTFPTLLNSDKLIHVVRNNSGATMVKGTIVYINGALGNKPTIAKALATGDSTSAQTYGVVQADIANNADGNIVVIGDVENLDTSAVTEGTQLYLSGSTAGAYTATKPYAPTHLVYVAIVLRSHPTLGIIGVKIQNGYEMDELHNVSAQSPANNDGLFYNTTTSLWEKNTISGVLGYTPVTSARTISTTSPLSGGGDLSANRTLTIAQATTSVSGYLSSTDWNTFNNKQGTITLTTTGSSGASTFVTGTLNIPTYTLAGLGGFANPMTTLGDLIYGGASGAATRIAGNITATKQFLSQTGTGTISAIPSWSSIAGSDITGAALTSTNDTNVTITLGGTPATSLLRAASITIGWTGTLADARIASAATWNAKESALTFSSPLSRATNTISIPAATTSVNGYLTSTDWTTFNGKQAGSTNLTSLSGLTYVSASFVKMTASGTFSLDTATYLTANQTITLSGDVSGSGTTAITTAIGTNKVTNAMLAQVATASFHGRLTAGIGNVETLTGTQATTLLDVFSSTLKGLTPASGGGTTNFLRADGTWAVPAGGGSGTVTSVSALTLGTTGTDLSSTVANSTTTPVITLNVPTASATNRGALSSTDWSTFNGKESALTFSSPLSRATNTISIPAATTSVNGYLTSSDWNTFNGKFNLPSLTSGSVLFSDGTTIAQDNANLFWDNTNNRLGVGTSSPANALDVVRGTAGTMARGFYESASVSYNADTKFGIYTASATATDGAALYLGQTNLLNSSSQYGGFELQYRYNSSTTENLRINYVSRLATGAVSTSTSDLLLISKTGAATFLSSVTATSFVKTSGTSAQILAADGSVITAGTNITISGGTISASGGGGTDFYTTNGTLTSARTISGGGFDLTYSDNKTTGTQFVVSNTTAGTTSSASFKANSDATAGYGFIGKVSSSFTTNAIITSSDLAIINYTAGDLVLLNTFATGLITFGVGTGTSPLMTLTSDGHLLINTSTNSTYHLDVNGDVNANKINISAGTATRCPLDFTPASAVLKTSPIAGDFEVDANGIAYYTHNTNERGVVQAEQFITLTSPYTLATQTAAQKLFNSPTNGAVTVKANTTYFFECLFYITNMSTTSGNFGFALVVGTATIASQLWTASAQKTGTVSTAGNQQGTLNTAANTALAVAGTQVNGFALIRGKFVTGTGGTIIPSVSFTVNPQATGAVQTNSYFRLIPAGINTIQSVGAWT